MNSKKMIKDTMKVGIGTMVGSMALGAVSNAPGMPKEAKTVSNLATSGLVLANVGQLSQNAFTVADMLKQKKKRTGYSVIDKILS